MTSNTTTKTERAEDIDLLLLAERIITFFQKFKWVFLIASVAGVLIGYGIYRSLPKVYKSRLVLHSFTLSNLDYIEVIANWNSLLKSGEKEELAKAMSIPVESVGQVKQLKAAEIQKVFTPSNPHGFYIDAYVSDNDVLDDLQKGILNGLQQVDYIKKEVTLKKENITRMIAEVTSELSKLDSTKAKVESMLDARNSQPSSMIIDISGLNKQRIELNEKLLYYKKDLEFATAVQVIQGFSHFSKPAGPNLIVWVGLGLITAWCVAFVTVFYRSIIQRINARKRHEPNKPIN